MATVAIAVAAGPGTRHPKVTIVSDTGVTVVLPYAPNEFEVKGHAPTFDQTPRPGRSPLLQRSGGQLPVVTMDIKVVRPDGAAVTGVLAKLVALIASGERVRVPYTDLTGGLWRITDNTIRETNHEFLTNACVEATVSLTLTRASDDKVQLGPVSGGLKSLAKPKAVVARPGESSASLLKRTASVAATPAAGAKKTTKKAGQLADANGIRDFRKVKPGSTISPKLPPR